MQLEESINTKKAWGWKIAAYLFLVGTGTGVFITGFLLSLFYSDYNAIFNSSALLGLPLVFIGILFLIWDLGKKLSAFLAFSRPGSSWISRGIIIITFFFVFALIFFGTGIWPSNWIEEGMVLSPILGSIATIFALLTLVYTGIALGAVKSVGLWNGVFLPGAFIISGFSTGIMVTALYLSVAGLSSEMPFGQIPVLLARYDSVLIIIEVLIIGLFLLKIYRSPALRVSTDPIISSNLYGLFWFGLVTLGLIVPFAVEVYIGFFSTVSHVLMMVLRALICAAGLFGGFLLRYIPITAGTKVSLNVNGIPVPLPRISGIRVFH